MEMNLNNRHTYAKVLVFVLLSVLNIHPGLSQHRSQELKRFTKNRALSENIIEDVFQDEKGFVWFGTYDGLYRFDGHEVKQYKYNHLDQTSIHRKASICIYVLWERRKQ